MNSVILRVTLCIAVILIVMQINCFCQSGVLMSVSGKAFDINKNIPMKDLLVILTRRENNEVKEIYSQKTDEKGFYKILNLKKGSYNFMLEVPNIGLLFVFTSDDNDDEYEFELKEGQNLHLNFFIGHNLESEIKKVYKSENVIDVTIKYAPELLLD